MRLVKGRLQGYSWITNIDWGGFGPRRGSFTRVGPLFGVGVDVKLHRIHVTPGLRYTHYNKLSLLTGGCSGQGCPSNKAVDFLIGFTF